MAWYSGDWGYKPTYRSYNTIYKEYFVSQRHVPLWKCGAAMFHQPFKVKGSEYIPANSKGEAARLKYLTNLAQQKTYAENMVLGSNIHRFVYLLG